MPASTFQMVKLDNAILRALRDHGPAATYVIRNRLNWPDLRTDHVLRACRRLERFEHVAEVRSRYTTMKTWEITEIGRQHLVSWAVG